MDILPTFISRKESAEATIAKIQSFPQEYQEELTAQLEYAKRQLNVAEQVIASIQLKIDQEAAEQAQKDALKLDAEIINLKETFGLESDIAKTKEEFMKAKTIYQDSKLDAEQKKYLLEIKGFTMSSK